VGTLIRRKIYKFTYLNVSDFFWTLHVV
jgi:hypothetical protein